jgi:hypothetical protein
VNSSTVDILGQISRNFIFHHFWKRGLRISGVESTESNSDPAGLSTHINGRDFLPTNTVELRCFDKFGSDIGLGWLDRKAEKGLCQVESIGVVYL